MCTVPSGSLRVLGSRVLQTIASSSGRQVCLAGPEGRGKTTLIGNIIKQGNHETAFSYYDFEANANHNFQVMVMQWTSSLISQHPLIKQASLVDTLAALEQLRTEIPDTDEHFNRYLQRILSHKRLDTRVSQHLSRVLATKDVVSGSVLSETCQMLLKHAPWTMGIKEPAGVAETEAIYHAVNGACIIAEKAELERRGESNPNSKLTAELTTTSLLRLLKALSHQLGKHWVLCLDGISHLVSSPFLRDRGEAFLEHLMMETRSSQITSVFISDSSTPFVKLLDAGLSNKLRAAHMLPPRDTAELKPDTLPLFFDVPEIETPVAMSILRENIWNSEAIAKALYRVSGGNIALLSKIVSSYRTFEETMDLPAVQQVLAGSENPVDDEYFPFKETMEDQTRYLQEERCKIFVRNLHNTFLKPEIGKFENLMNQFLSLPMVEEIKNRLENRVHFWVTVSETIRYMLRKPVMQLKPGATIENRILLALLAVGIVQLNLHSRTVEFKDSLTKLLLETYINKEYESLSWIKQVEYKANFLLNQKPIYRGLDDLLL